MKFLTLALVGAAVAVTAAPADARHPSREAAYRVGYAFGPRYGYTEFTALPPPMVTRYHLRNNFRYVHRDGFVYVVNPRTYRVVRVLPG